VKGLRTILGDKLFGAYVYGAAASTGAGPARDIDFHVVLKEPLTSAERSALEGLHKSLARQFPPLGGELDGYYILLEDARAKSPPMSLMWQRPIDNSWALHREHIRSGRCLVLHGPDPTGVSPPATWPELEQALRGELGYVEKHLHDYPDYCILNLCRLVYSFETGEVVISKAAAADWARSALPEWVRLIEAARNSYAGRSAPQEREFMLAEVRGLFDFARARIEQAAAKRNGKQFRPRANTHTRLTTRSRLRKNDS